MDHCEDYIRQSETNCLFQQPQEGLLSNHNKSIPEEHSQDLFQIITDSDSSCSGNSQGTSSSSPKSGPSNFSFYNWKTELRNALAGLKLHRASSYAIGRFVNNIHNYQISIFLK